MISLPPAPTDEAVLGATLDWLERADIGFSLVPFAKAVHVKGQIRHYVSAARHPGEALVELRRELAKFAQAEPEVVDTELLILPHVFAEFFEYNSFLERADAEL